MGLWDSIKNIADSAKELALKAKCGMGFHDGTFAPVEGKPACFLSMRCADCLELIEQRRHAYPREWEQAPHDYRSQIKCMRTQSCIHCGEEASKVVHGHYYTAGKNGRCVIILRCEDCGNEKEGDVDHDFYRAMGNSDGTVTYRCSCGAAETRRY